MHTFIEKNEGLVKLVAMFVALFLVAATIGKLKEYRFIGSGVGASNTITVVGEGKIDRAPDTAKISFSVRSESKVLKDAQSSVSEKVDAVTKALKELGVEEKYIKTESYNSYPQYDYASSVSCYGGGCPPVGTPKIRGYEVAHSITVSVKDLEKVNDVLGVLGTQGVSDMSGPQFGFEDDSAIAREARALAITDAKEEAKSLAKSLGVRLVRIVSFSENGGGYPMYARAEMSVGASDAKAVAPALPIGDQNVQSQVTIVYEIK